MGNRIRSSKDLDDGDAFYVYLKLKEAGFDSNKLPEILRELELERERPTACVTVQSLIREEK
ncbi:hypothetical protein BH780_gp170 [Bacillus phage Eldridge]|uniref:Uncharacterized protein n=1 Tax=Bacillus phage Eldridge TaxID=1776293 RepID=A0A0Y0AGU3_9CAUD|nr:hypothetical protein BH780_gp170 [Bacillus phage Eldridge]AMB18753.1 hypothetical protein Eldridge_0173 [Bacillus phage Eldridge]